MLRPALGTGAAKRWTHARRTSTGELHEFMGFSIGNPNLLQYVHKLGVVMDIEQKLAHHGVACGSKVHEAGATVAFVIARV